MFDNCSKTTPSFKKQHDKSILHVDKTVDQFSTLAPLWSFQHEIKRDLLAPVEIRASLQVQLSVALGCWVSSQP